MPQLAQAYVRLRIDSGQVKKDVQKGLAGASEGGNATKAGEDAGSSFSSGFQKESSAKIKKASEAVAKAGSVALIGIGVASLKMAADFQKGLVQLTTSAGESTKNLDLISKGVLALSVSTNTSTKDLTAGLYTIESAGYHGAKGLAVLRAAAQGAVTENASLATVSDALTTVMNDYHLKTSQATSVTSALITTVAHGKTHLEDLASSLSRVLPTAAALHVSFPQIAGDLAVLTAHGVSARLAAQGLNSTMIALASPSNKAALAMQSVGISANQVQKDLGTKGLTYVVNELSDAFLKHAGPSGQLVLATMKGLPPALQTVAHQFLAGTITSKQWTAATKNLTVGQKAQVTQFVKTASSATGLKQGYVSALGAMVGGQRGLAVALQLTGKNATIAKGDTDAIAQSYAHGATSVDGFKEASHTLSFEFGQLGKEAEATAITLGQKMLPAVTSVVSYVGSHEGTVTTFAEALAGVAIAVTAITVSAKGFAFAKTVVGGFAAAGAAVKGFTSTAVAAAGVEKTLTAASAGGLTRLQAAQVKLAAAAEGTAGAETAFAVGAEGSTVATSAFAVGAEDLTVALGELTVAERAAAIAGAALDAVNPAIWAVAAVIGVAALGVAISRMKGETSDLTVKLHDQAGATGFNVAGYQKLAASLSTVADRQKAAAAAAPAADSSGLAHLTELNSAALQVSQTSKQAASEAANFSGRMASLRGQFNLTATGAERLAANSGVLPKAFAASGTAGQAAFNRVQKYASGLTATQLASYQAATASTRFSDSLSIVSGRLLTGQGDLLSYRLAQKQALQAINASSTGLKGNSTAALAAKQAVLQSTQQAIQFANQEKNQAGGMKNATATIRDQIKWLETHAAKSKFAAQEVDALRKALATIKSVHASVSVVATGAFHITNLSTGGGGTSHVTNGPAGLKAGGRLAGYGGGDRNPALLEDGETVVSKDDSRLPYMVSAFKAAGVPGYTAGGVVGSYSGNPKGLGTFLVRMDQKTLVALANATGQATATALKQAQAAANAPGAAGPGGGAPSANAALARRLMPAWSSGAAWDAWNAVEMREAGWNQYALNRSSGAYGIPQALPASKMGAAANPPQSNPTAQINWMVSYIQGRYGDPQGAWAHEENFGWYAGGTGGASPGWAWVGEQGKELMYSPHGGETIYPHGMSMAITRGYAGGTPNVGKPIKPPKPVKGGRTKLEKDTAELDRDEKELTALRKTTAAHIATLRRPIDRNELFLINHPHLSAVRKKALEAEIGKAEKGVSSYRDKQGKKEDVLEKAIRLLKALVASDPKPPPGKVGKPPPLTLGTKKQELAELAKDVKSLSVIKKATTAHLKPMRRKLELEELQLLTVNLSPSQKLGLQAEIKKQEAAITKYRKGQTGKEGTLDQEITLLRQLTGEPVGTKYGGPGSGDSGTGDDGGGDGSGDDSGSGSTAPVQALPTPGWLGGAGGAGGFGPGGSTGTSSTGGGGLPPGFGGAPGSGSPVAGLPTPGGSAGGSFGSWSGGASGAGNDAALSQLMGMLGGKLDTLTNVSRAIPAGTAQGLDGVGRSARQRAFYRPH